MNQPSLFELGGYQPKRARDTDPATSQEGAKHIGKSAAHHRKAMYLAFAAGRKTANEAAQECSTAYGGNQESYRKRVSELLRGGRIRVCDERRCYVTNRRCRVFEVIR